MSASDTRQIEAGRGTSALDGAPSNRPHGQQDSRLLLRFAAQVSGVGVWERDLRTGAIWASDTCRQTLGFGPGEPFDISVVRKAVHPDDLDRMLRAEADATPGCGDYDVEYRLIRRDGTVTWVQTRAQVIADAGGRPARVAGITLDVTARRASETRLQVSEESLRLATEAAEIGTWDLDLPTDTLTWSDRTKAMFGVPSDRAVSLDDFFTCLHPDDLEATRAAFTSALDPAIRATYDVEYRTVGLTDDVVRWVAAKGRGLFDADGVCIRALGTAIDITARREADARLRASEALLQEGDAKFRAITDSIDQMVWSTCPDGFHDYYNQRWYDFTGVPSGSIGGASWTGLFHPADHDRVWSRWQHCLATGEPYEVEYRLRHRSGTYRWVLGRAVPQRDAGIAGVPGPIVRWFGTCTDIEEIMQAREVLARSRADLERQVASRTAERDRTWRNAQDLLLVIGTDGIIRAVNPAWTRVLGWPAEALVGRCHLDFLHPDDQDAATPAMEDVQPGGVVQIENRLRHRDGGHRWIAWVAAPEGDLVYASGRHVTAEREQAAALARTEAQLRQAQKMEAVGQLTGGIAHDFNNLLTGIMGALELIQRRVAEGRTDGLDRFAGAAIASAARASALTQRLLAFARRQPLDPNPVDANVLVTGMEDLLRGTLGPAVVLDLVLGSDVWLTLCDMNQLESAVLNLAINARDAMPAAADGTPAGGRLTIETGNAVLDESYATSQDGDVVPGDYVVIAVTDTGVGMDAETIARAFEPFFTTKLLGQGTGLGLSMVYGFVKQSRGHVRIHSAVGQGSTFRLYLPRLITAGVAALPVAHADEPRAAGAANAASVAGAAGQTVVVIEDEAAVRMVMVEGLTDRGYRVIEAADGPEGLRALENADAVDLLITDVGLPAGMNGCQVADAARRLRPALKVLFVTGFAGNAAVGNDMLERGTALLTKPFAVDALLAKVATMVAAD